jgi:hypothetical protein
MPGAVAFVVKRVGFVVNGGDALIHLDQGGRFIRIERNPLSDKLHLVVSFQHRLSAANDKLKFAGDFPHFVTPLRKTSITISAIGSSL